MAGLIYGLCLVVIAIAILARNVDIKVSIWYVIILIMVNMYVYIRIHQAWPKPQIIVQKIISYKAPPNCQIIHEDLLRSYEYLQNNIVDKYEDYLEWRRKEEEKMIYK